MGMACEEFSDGTKKNFNVMISKKLCELGQLNFV